MGSAVASATLRAGYGGWTGKGLVLDGSSGGRSATLARYAEEWLALSAGLGPRTLEGYRYRLERHVYPRLGRQPLAEIEPEDILRLLRDLRLRGYSAWTQYSVILVLKVIFTRPFGVES